MLKKFVNLDHYLKDILQFDFFDKNIKFSNFFNFVIFQFKYLKLNLDYFNQLYSKIYFMIRTFSYNLKYKITKFFILTKKHETIDGFFFRLVFKNFQDICVSIDFLRYIFVRFLFVNKQIFGIGMFLNFKVSLFKNIKKKFIFFKLYQNDLLFRVNSLMDSLLNRENFIYFYENIDIFYEFIFGCFNVKTIFKLFFTYFGFFIINYKKFIKKYKTFMFYTLIM